MYIIPRLKPYFSGNFNLIFINSLIRRSIIKGNSVKKFEKKVSEYLGTKYAIAVGSGRIGMYLILDSFDLKEGDEIILPPYTCNILPKIILCMGLKPIFVDIDPNTLNINPKLIEGKITKRTKAIIATHINGFPCDIDPILKIAKKYNLKVIEDIADSLGAIYKKNRTGSLGNAAFLSFNLGKHINTFGGGMITTNDRILAERIEKKIKKLKEQKPIKLFIKLIKSNIISIFTNPKIFFFTVYPLLLLFNVFNKDPVTSLFEEAPELKEIPVQYFKKYSNYQALLGLKQLINFDNQLMERINNAQIIKNKINRKHIQKTLSNTNPSYLNFIIKVKNRKKIEKMLLKKGIDTQPSWMKTCSSLNLPSEFNCKCGVSDKLVDKILYIPIYPNLDGKNVNYIAERLNEILK